MVTYLVRRSLLMIPTLLGITLMVFMLLALAPGGIGASMQAAGGQGNTTGIAQQQAYLEDRYGLSEPVIVQYGKWLSSISPIKFGTRDLRMLSGERVSVPRPIPEPSLPQVFPPPAMPSVVFTPSTDESQIAEFKGLQRDAEGARRSYVGSVRLFRDALADVARAVGAPLVGRLDGKGGAKPNDFADVLIVLDAAQAAAAKAESENISARSGAAPAKVASNNNGEKNLVAPSVAAQHVAQLALARAKLFAAAKTMDTNWALAEETRQRATIAFTAGPYPKSGFPIIPNLVSLDTSDFGVAFSKNRPVWDLIIEALPVTLLINLIAFPISYLIAVPTGVIASVRRGSWFDTLTGVLYLSLYSIPTVLAGVFAIGFLANNQYLGLFPVSGLHDTTADTMAFLPSTNVAGVWKCGWLLDLVWHIALPVLCLTYGSFAILSKQTRASMLDNLSADYVRTAKAKGVARNDVVVRHVFRNSLLPLITMFVGIFPAMLGGSVVVERIFSVPGMGSLVLDAISNNDRDLILADVLMIAAVNVFALLLADILYAVADPRVSYE